MGGFYPGNLDTGLFLLLNYGIYLAVRIVGIYVAEFTAIDHDDVRGIGFSGAYLLY